MKPDTQKLLKKAHRSIRAAEKLLAGDDIDFAASRAYYAVFYLAEALLLEKELQFKKHGGVHAAFAEHFVKTGLMDAKFHRWLIDAFDERIQGDYEIESELDGVAVKMLIERAYEFYKVAQSYLSL